MERPQAAGLELAGQLEQLIGDLQLALGAHGPKAPGLKLADHRVNEVHGSNVLLRLAPGKKQAGDSAARPGPSRLMAA